MADDATRRTRGRELFLEALELEESARAEFLEEACGGDPTLRREVESLLRSLARADSFLETPWAPSSPLPDLVGADIGQFHVEALHATGGMGAVYLAHQEQPRRRVALKVLRPGAATPEALRRFELEAEMLGRLQHRHIAQVYDAGMAQTARGCVPYLAMEFIDGVSLTEHVVSHRLDVAARVRLLVDVCEAVHHAHQRGVIHRDLKPSNILVRRDGDAKVVDFGVARASGWEGAGALHTVAGEIVGTLAYMSPEQVRGGGEDLDVRTDVYSLGVVAHEVLCGRRPYEVADRPLVEVARIIQEQDPPPLQVEDRTRASDLDAVVRRALRKAREDRYPSAAALATDLRCVLDHRPVDARPPSAAYHLRKFCRRHRGLVIGAALAVLALAAGTTVSTVAWLQSRASRQQETRALGVARHEADLRGEINQILKDMLVAPDPFQGSTGDRQARVVDVLDRAAATLEQGHRSDEVREEVHRLLGRTYRNLGALSRAERQFDHALLLARELHGERHLATAESLEGLALTYYDQARLQEGEPLQRRALELHAELVGPEDARTLQSMSNLALFLMDRGALEEAESLWRTNLAARRRQEGSPPALALALNNLGDCLIGRGQYDEARSLLEESLALRQRIYPEGHPRILATQNALARLLGILQEPAASLEMFREAVRFADRSLGADNVHTAILKGNFAAALVTTRRFDEAEPLLRDVLSIPRSVLPSGHRGRTSALNWLRYLLQSTGRDEEAQEVALEAFRLTRAAPDASHERITAEDQVRRLLQDRGAVVPGDSLEEQVAEQFGDLPPLGLMHWTTALARRGDLEAVTQAYQVLVERTPDRFPEHDWTPALFESHLGLCLVAQGELEEAELHLLAGHERLAATLGPADPRTLEAVRDLIDLYEEMRLEEEAQEFREVLAAAREQD